MNKELINKYKKEFDHWLNGGKLLYKHINSNAWWNNEPWEYSPDYITAIIINDEYAEFRKALAEGKTIQYKTAHCNWIDYIDNKGNPCNIFGTGGTYSYRIKPDEPNFKVGDFVTPLNREINCSVWQIDKVLSCNTLVSNSIMLDPRTIQLWTPIKGEWCWFYDDLDSKYSHLEQFYDMHIFEDNSISTFMSNTITKWYYCEPFLNSIPSYLKDK